MRDPKLVHILVSNKRSCPVQVPTSKWVCLEGLYTTPAEVC